MDPACGAVQGLYRVQPKSLGKLPEKHTYVWHLDLVQQITRHDDTKCLQDKIFGNSSIAERRAPNGQTDVQNSDLRSRLWTWKSGIS